MIKRSIQEEDITMVNIYAPNREAPQPIKKMILAKKGKIDSVLHLHQLIDHSNKINKETKALNVTLDQTELIFT